MAVTIGSARIDERGGASGGRAGDQTGKEVSTQAYYVHRLGWRVFRAKSVEAAKRIAACMRAACANACIGYDQGQRNTLWNEAEKYGFDVSKVTAVCETDCSALVRVCCAYAGITGLPSGFRTANMAGCLLGTGAFTEMKGTKYTASDRYLRAGDILVTRTAGHTVVALNDGVLAEKDSRLLPVYGDTGEAVRVLQRRLIALGFSCGQCGADGEYGPDTRAAMTRFLNGRTLTDTETLEALFGRAEVRGGDCNLRDAPDVEARKLGIARRGERFIRTGEIAENGWVAVVHEGAKAWASGKYMKV